MDYLVLLSDVRKGELLVLRLFYKNDGSYKSIFDNIMFYGFDIAIELCRDSTIYTFFRDLNTKK